MNFVKYHDVMERFKGKSIAIVGSAPSCKDNDPEYVDSHDIVIRINNYKLIGSDGRGPSRRLRGTGRRTDVHYSFYGNSIKKRKDELARDGVRFCMCKCPDSKPVESPWHEKRGKTEGIDFRYIYRQRKDFWFCPTYIPETEKFLSYFRLMNNHVPTTGFSCILDVLGCDIRKAYITGFDFFTSSLHNVNEPWNSGNPSDPLRHVPLREALWLKEALGNYPIELDSRLKEILL